VDEDVEEGERKAAKPKALFSLTVALTSSSFKASESNSFRGGLGGEIKALIGGVDRYLNAQ
jgi:hypothetical protein